MRWMVSLGSPFLITCTVLVKACGTALVLLLVVMMESSGSCPILSQVLVPADS